MHINIDAFSTPVNIPLCTSIEVIQEATQKDTDLQKLKSYIIKGCLYREDEVEHSMKCY